MEKETKKTLLNLLTIANEKGINETTFYKLNDIEDLLYYLMTNEEYNKDVVEMQIAVKAQIAVMAIKEQNNNKK
jgi:hypothetical protein